MEAPSCADLSEASAGLQCAQLHSNGKRSHSHLLHALCVIDVDGPVKSMHFNAGFSSVEAIKPSQLA